MKSQRRLRLRGVGRHHRTEGYTPWPGWTYTKAVQRNLSRAFEMDVWPRHYADNSDRPTYYTTMSNYLTGVVVDVQPSLWVIVERQARAMRLHGFEDLHV